MEYSLSLDGVVYSEDYLYCCSSDGLKKLKEAIVKHSLNRVVVASCTPRTHEHLFQHACKDAGLNPYLFEMANIRDQCSWVHMNRSEEATKKAKDLVHMAVAKARLLEPLEEPEIEIRAEALVIGGGISGMTAAISLSNQGFHVHLVEKEEELGGMLLRLDRLFPTNIKSEELLKPRVRAIESDPNIIVHKCSRVRGVSGFIGNFEVEVNNTQGEVEILKVGTIIVATGADNIDPVGLYSFGEDRRIVTQLQFEEILKSGDLEAYQTIVMIQCVGSRNEDRPYCSRVCCSEAMKNATTMMALHSKSKVYILYRDLQTYGTSYTPLEWEAKKSLVKLLKYDAQRPPEVTPGDRAITVRVYSPLLDEDVRLEADLVVLSTPLIPRSDAVELSQILRVPLNPDGFFMEAHVKLRPLDFATDGVYVCGTAHSPKEIGESIAQALGAASRAAIPMASGKLRTAAIVAVVDKTRCTGCGTCVEVCPYNAIQKDITGVAKVTAGVCKGCGVCGASCPEKAITMQHFTNKQLEAQAFHAWESG
jgi:heterodisulfide reductase subunit A